MTESLPGPAYRIETARLVIRCWNPADAPLLQAATASSVEHLRPWMPWVASEPEQLQVKVERLRHFRGMFDLGQDFIYGIFNRAETQVLGGSGLHTRLGAGAREIGYWLRQDAVGQGFITETSAALIRVAFEIEQVQRIEIHCDPENVRSAAVPRKLGFTHDATLRRRTPFLDEAPRDRMIWSLFANEYPTSPAATAAVVAFDAAGRPLALA